MKKLLYFGCIGQAGHYWFENDNATMSYKDRPTFPIDGEYVPKGSAEQGTAREAILGNYRIVAGNDYTGDSRLGSNSALVGLGYETKEEMLADAVTQFPSVMRRQPKPLNFDGEKKA